MKLISLLLELFGIYAAILKLNGATAILAEQTNQTQLRLVTDNFSKHIIQDKYSILITHKAGQNILENNNSSNDIKFFNTKKRFPIGNYSWRSAKIYYGLDNPIYFMMQDSMNKALKSLANYSREKLIVLTSLYSKNVLESLVVALNRSYDSTDAAKKYLNESFFSETQKSVLLNFVLDLYCYEGFNSLLESIFNENKIPKPDSLPSEQIITYKLLRSSMNEVSKWEANIIEKISIAVDSSFNQNKITEDILDALSLSIDKELSKVVESQYNYVLENFDKTEMIKAFVEYFRKSINIGACKCVKETAQSFLKLFAEKLSRSEYVLQKSKCVIS